MDALGAENQSDVEVAGLNEQDQQALENFPWIGQPVHPRRVTLPNLGEPSPKLREDVARLRSRWTPRELNSPLFAVYNKPSTEKSTETQFFCEACTVSMPAGDQDWQMHIEGVSHLCQLLSLCGTGELGHIPRGEF